MKRNVARCTSTGLHPLTVGNGPDRMGEENRLLSQLRAREEQAFETVMIHYQETFTRMAMRYVANRETAEDIVQETWIAVMNGLNRFEGRSSLRAWIGAIVIHKAKDRGVRDKRQKVFSAFELETVHWNGEPVLSRFRLQREGAWPAPCSRQLWDERTPETLLASRQATACLWHAIETLPTHQKDVLMLRDVDGVHTQEVFEQLKIFKTNLYVRLHRAREQVRTAVTAVLG